MALVVNLQSSEDQKFWKLISADKNQLMKLRDYLRDDLSSCSSSGFKSFPRRQCCSAARFHDDSFSNSKRTHLKKSRSRSVIKRASDAILRTVKQLTITSTAAAVQNRRGNRSKSFSRRWFSFWRKSDRDDKEIGRFKSFSDFLEEENQSSNRNSAAATTAVTASPKVQKSTGSNAISWSESESEFTADVLPSSSDNSENYSVTDGIEVKSNSPAKEVSSVSNRIAVTAGDDSVISAKEWRKEEGKEHFSPVSVLENPFEDEDEEDSPFQLHHSRAGGIKKKLLVKKKFAQIQPLDLEKRIESCVLEDEPPGSLKFTEAEDLLKQLKAKSGLSNLKFTVDSVLLDFFGEKNAEGGFDLDLLRRAEEWLYGKCPELILGWEVSEGRMRYWKELERNAEWSGFEGERIDLVVEIEVAMFTSLVDELFIDLC